MERLKKQMEFLMEVDKLKQITRQSYLADGSRKENDAEHSWHLAMMCVLLREHANEDFDVLKTVAMVLIHDIVEIDAGDTYAYDEKGSQSKAEREQKAADRLFGILPKDQGEYFMGLWREFEECRTPEARFASAMDRFQPMSLNSASEGKSWKEHEVAVSQVLKRNARMEEGSSTLWNYAKENFLKKGIENGTLKNDVE